MYFFLMVLYVFYIHLLHNIIYKLECLLFSRFCYNEVHLEIDKIDGQTLLILFGCHIQNKTK